MCECVCILISFHCSRLLPLHAGVPVLGEDKEHSQIQLKLRCASAYVQNNLIPAGDHCGFGKTGTPDVYDSDCATGYCAWVSSRDQRHRPTHPSPSSRCFCVSLRVCFYHSLTRFPPLPAPSFPSRHLSSLLTFLQDCQDMTVSLCLSCYYGDCRCKQKGERLDPETGEWVNDR
jgi:hypothetical protein